MTLKTPMMMVIERFYVLKRNICQHISVRKFITYVYLGNVQFINYKFNIFSKMLSSYPTCCITNDKDIGLLNAVIAFFVTFNYLVFIVYVNVFLHMFLVQI